MTGAVLVAATLVSVAAGGGATAAVAVDRPDTPAALERPAETGPEPDDEGMGPAEDEDDEDDDAKPVDLPPVRACEVSDEARAEARERVASALVLIRATLDELRAAQRSHKGTKTLDQAKEMLRELAENADRALVEMCGDVQAVADRAVSAMETVVSLARQAATATPSPKPTEKPRATPAPTTKPSRTPSCDDRLYATKLALHAAFERFHSLHDKLYFAHKRSSTELARLVIANDEAMHRTYDESKQRILSSSCAGDMGAAIAAKAAATFERLYQSSAQAVAAQSR